MMTPIGRGDVVQVRLDSVVQVVPITGLQDRPLRPYEARLENDSSGLKMPSRAVANQIRTVANHRLTKRLCSLSTGELEAVDHALAIQLGLPITPSSPTS